MSIVGPRPPLRSEVDCLRGGRAPSPVHQARHSRDCGRSAAASDLSWEESVRLDLYYVENWSLTGDLMIIWRTFKTILKPVGAY